MQRLELGTAQGIEALYREHGKRLWWAVLAFAGSREVADDAVAEAFAQAIRRGDALREPLSWIWRAAFRIAAGEQRRRHRFSAQVPEVSYEMPEETTTLLEALGKLSTSQRAAVVLHFYADRPTGEIAQILGVGEPTVSVHLHRATKRLRILLEETRA